MGVIRTGPLVMAGAAAVITGGAARTGSPATAASPTCTALPDRAFAAAPPFAACVVPMAFRAGTDSSHPGALTVFFVMNLPL